MYELGTGVLNWPPSERINDTYCCIFLSKELDSEERVALDAAYSEKVGKLAAVVQQARKSRHIGDLFWNVFPSTPAVGEKIVLGTGRLFIVENASLVCLLPAEAKIVHLDDLTAACMFARSANKRPFLNLHALYRAHEQTVTLFFDETTEL